MADDLAYRSVGSIDQADLGIPDTFTFIAIGSGSEMEPMNFALMSLAGIGTTSEPGYVNSIGKDLLAGGRFNPGEDCGGPYSRKTFDVQGEE
jgi:hypothetical protein